MNSCLTGKTYKSLESGILVPQNFKRYPLAFDFFAGCGGFSLGLIQAGFEVVGALEIDPSAAHTYMFNLGSHPIKIHYTSEKYKKILENYFEKHFKKLFKNQYQTEIFTDLIDISEEISGSGWIKAERKGGKYHPSVKNFFFGDIREVSGKWILDRLGLSMGQLDAVVGGPPCQGFSKANKDRKPDDPRNDLIFEFARMVVEMQPKTLVMEEVPSIVDFVTPEGIPVIDAFCSILEDGDFGRFNALRSSIMATSGVGLVKKGTGFRYHGGNGNEKRKKVRS